MKEILKEPNWGMKELPSNNLKMIDLFCGAGVGAVGFKLAGYEIVYAVDNMQYAVDTYNKNIGNHAVQMDIRKLKSEEIPNADIITGGFPCQPFSFSGTGKGEKDEQKGDLGYHFYRIIKEKQPKAFLMENVDGIISKKHRPFFLGLMKLFEEAGYDVFYPTKDKNKEEPIAINCWEYGVPQLRKRVFVVGVRKDLNKKFTFPEPIPMEERKNIRYAIGDLPDPNGVNNHSGYGVRKDESPFIDKVPPGGNWRDIPEEDQKAFLGKAFYSGGGKTGFLRKVSFDNPAFTVTSMMNGKNNAQILDNLDKYSLIDIKNQDKYYDGDYSSRYKSRNRQKQWNEPSFTIVSQARQLPLYPEPANYDIRNMDNYEIAPPRRFTVRECLRLQTVPDWFSFDNNISLIHQYERCSGIPSLMAYKLGIELAILLSK
ncbi:MAG: fnuDIM [Clostridiaceae bacterium]|jgi:DNA (cytosine-5)-methyltransferase 1|nr:fnuDIM [Clostridiaceae bacterium]